MNSLYTETVSPRSFLGDIWVEIGKKDPRTVVLDCDLAAATKTDAFADAYPDRFFEMGIGEQNAMSVSAGLAAEELIPFYANFALFSSGTCWTQLRQNCFSNLNVKIVATHPGMDNGPDGGTHHANEEIALTRTIPCLTVLSPADHFQVRAAMFYALQIQGPVYIRVPRDETPVLHSANTQFSFDTLEMICDKGDDFAIVYEGSAALQACDGFMRLEDKKLKGKLLAVPSLKPFDNTGILDIAKQVKAIVTVENHSVYGGLGGIVAETLCTSSARCPVGYVGVNDVFTESGKSQAVKSKFGLSAEAVEKKVLSILGCVSAE